MPNTRGAEVALDVVPRNPPHKFVGLPPILAHKKSPLAPGSRPTRGRHDASKGVEPQELY